MSRPAEHADFAERLAERRRRAIAEARPLLHAAGAGGAAAGPAARLVRQTTDLVARTLDDLGEAEQELRTLGDELLAARLASDGHVRFYRELFDHAPLPYLVTDALAVVRHANAAATQLLRRPVNGVVGKPLVLFVPLAERPAFRSGLARCADAVTSAWPVQLATPGRDPVEVTVHTRIAEGAAGGPPVIYWLLIPGVAGDADLL